MNLYPQHYDEKAVTTCGDCGAKSTAEELDPIQDPSQRLCSGDPLPAGECLICGSLSYVAERQASQVYTVKAEKQIAFGHLHELDHEVEGEYHFSATSRGNALDQFHDTVPVKVLDDFEFTAYNGLCGDCGAAGDPGASCRKCGRGVIG